MKTPNSIDPEKRVKKEIATLNKDEMFLPTDFYVPMDREDFKAYLRQIRTLEQMVRQSLEYKNFVKYLKQELNLNKCIFLPGVDQTNERIKQSVTIELHHYPFTLFDITDTIVKRERALGFYPIDRFKVANLITLLHYQLKIGLVPLSSTAHELAHAGKLFIHLDQVHGNYEGFLKEFYPYISDELKETLESIDGLGKATGREGLKDTSNILDISYRTVIMPDRKVPEEIGMKTESNVELKEIEQI